jgi:amino acid transporter
MARISPVLRPLMLAGAALSMFGWLGSDVMCSPRILLALARDGLMPRVLGRVHPRYRSPHVAIVCYCTLAIGLALTGTFGELAVLSTLAIAPLYIAGCAAAWQLKRRDVALAGEPLNFRWLRTAMLIGIAGMLAMIALASRAEILGLVAIVVVSSLAYLLRTRWGANQAAAG